MLGGTPQLFKTEVQQICCLVLYKMDQERNILDAVLDESIARCTKLEEERKTHLAVLERMERGTIGKARQSLKRTEAILEAEYHRQSILRSWMDARRNPPTFQNGTRT